MGIGAVQARASVIRPALTIGKGRDAIVGRARQGYNSTMTFALSKLLWWLVQPANGLLLALIAGLALRRWWRRLGTWLAGLALATLVLLAATPLSVWLAAPLENRFPAIEPPPAVDGIIVLGGSFNLRLSEKRHQIALNDHAERLTAFAALARRYPKARLVFTGGTGMLRPGTLTESQAARRLFAALGLDIDRIQFEDRSRNTYENAVLSRDLVGPKAGERWLLLTSAFHMPRAVGCFRAAGWPVIAYPVDYMTAPAGETRWQPSFVGGLQLANRAAHEWLGLIAYRLMGRIDSWFPAPGPGAGRRHVARSRPLGDT